LNPVKQDMDKQATKVWIVTGTSSGIGRVLVQKLLEAGYFVTATARNRSKIEDFEKNYPSQCLSIEADVTMSEANQRVVNETLKRFGKIDVLVNNAGYGLAGVLEEVTLDQIRRQMDTNVIGLIEMTQLVIPTMRKQQSGYIVNISSIAGLRGSKGLSIYSASKFAVTGFSESLALEVSRFGIKVSCVEPGPYRTDWAGRSIDWSESITNPDSPYYEINSGTYKMLNSVSGNQPGNPEQIASVLIAGAEAEHVPMHMLFGDEAIGWWKDYHKKVEDDSFFRHYPHSKYDL
jgi:NAD(P)-dependent dehydrogenase (short-subunit alcohol dehydrogenase family)